MAGRGILQELPIGKAGKEERSRRGYTLMQQEAREKLEPLDEAQHVRAPENWLVVELREWTGLYRLEEVTVRQPYRDEKDSYHFLLDGYVREKS